MSAPPIPNISGFIFSTRVIDGVPTLLVWNGTAWNTVPGAGEEVSSVPVTDLLSALGDLLEESAEAQETPNTPGQVSLDCGTFGA